MKNLSIKAKIFGAFGLVLLILSGLGGFAVFELSTVNATGTDMATNWLPALRWASQLNTDTSDFRGAEATHVLSTTEPEMAKVEAVMTELEEEIKKDRAAYEPLIASPQERAVYEEFGRQWTDYMTVHQNLLGLSKQNLNEQATTVFKNDSAKAFDAATKALNEIIDINVKGGDAASALGDATYSTASMIIFGAIALSIMGVLALAWTIVRGVSVPITAMTEAMTKLGAGDKTIVVVGLERADEIGGMAKALQVFKETAIRADEMAAQQAKDQEAKAKRQKQIDTYIVDFDKQSAEALNTTASAATQLQMTAQSMTATAEETGRQSTTVAAAAEQASTNVQTVATAAEQLTASVAEISRQVAESATIAARAVEDAKSTDATVQGLAASAQEIGKVVSLINDIASQTNLLALNATIEAARAGESGKGFAVVASEVKNLATQTAKATEEIGAQISAMQGVTGEAVKAIQGIGATIGQISHIATAIAGAVEQQGAATKEIARNVQEASAGTREVSSNITGVSQAAAATGQSASEVLSASQQLSKLSTTLKTQIDTFLHNVKAA